MLNFLLPTLLATAYTVNSIAALPVVGDASCSVLSQTKSSSWQPKAGTTFEIVLQGALKNTNTVVTAFDVDLIANDASFISDLHSKGRKVICYFSAGSYEDDRPDSKAFQASDYGRPFGRLARSKGCDAVDPDNVNGFGNDIGFSLSKADVVDYLKFLAEAAHSLGMAIGLKNAGDIVPQLVDQFHFAVNPQCHNYSECGLTRPFITAGNPVFHTEYPDGAPNVDARLKTPSATTHLQRPICNDPSARGFSTPLKNMDLDEWYDACPAP